MPDQKRECATQIWETLRPRFHDLMLAPTLAVYSGNGLHFHYILPSPVDCTDSERYKCGYKAIMAYLEREVFQGKYKLDPLCARVSQPIRLPGSTNWKDPNHPMQTQVLEINENFKAHGFTNVWSVGEDERESKKLVVLKSPLTADLDEYKEKLRSALTFQGILKAFDYQKFDSITCAHAQGEMLCSSPFGRSDRKASVKFNEEKKVYHDWTTDKGGDIFHFLAKMMEVNHQKDFKQVMEKAQEITGIKPPVRKEQRKTPFKEDYFEFFDEHLKGARVCLLSREFKIMDNGIWQTVSSRLKELEGHALESRFLNHCHLQQYLALYEKQFDPKLLVDVPEWDGVDYVAQFAKALNVVSCTQGQAQEVLKEWGSRMFERLRDPMVQNRVLILEGKQGIGKDYWITSVIKGLGPLKTNLSIKHQEADNLAMLADHLALNISEFDRTNQTEMSTLKDWITMAEATFRRPYERAARKYNIHTSFISSVNVKDILRDPTGNRRFVIVEVGGITHDYPTDKSMEILAQFQALSQIPYRMSEETRAVIDQYMEQLTPDDPEISVLEEFDSRLVDYETTLGKTEFSFGEISEAIASVSRNHNFRGPKRLLAILKRTKRSRHERGGSKYFRLKSAEN